MPPTSETRKDVICNGTNPCQLLNPLKVSLLIGLLLRQNVGLRSLAKRVYDLTWHYG